MTELQAVCAGDLALYIDEQTPVRVEAVREETDAVRADTLSPHDGLAHRHYLRNLQPIPGADPQVFSKAPLCERRNRLAQNLARARDNLPRTEQDSRSLLYGVRRAILDCTDRDGSAISSEYQWFWLSVAESTDDPRQVSWAERIQSFDNDPHRKRGRWSVFLKKAREYGLDVSDEEAGKVSYLVGTHFPRDYNLTYEIVRGQAVLDAYNDSKGPHSCMKGQPFTEFYAANPDKVGLVKLSRGGQYFGRALLWTLDEPQGRIFLDRIYPSDGGDHIEWLKDIARVNGWIYKTEQTYGNCLSEDDLRLQVSMDVTAVSTYPYMDTLCYATDTLGEGEIILSNRNQSAFEVDMTSTDGIWPGEDESYVYSEWHSMRIPRDEATYIASIDTWVRDSVVDDYFALVGDRYERMEDCVYSDEQNEWLLREDATRIEYRRDWVSDDRATTCDYTGETCLDSDVVETYEGLSCWRDRAVELGGHSRESGNGRWAYEGDDHVVERDGEWVLRDEEQVEPQCEGAPA